MYKISNPLIWLRRFRHRCGYGVHSPFAFRFITDILYMNLPYYAYEELDRELPFGCMFRVRKILHMLLRLSNWRQPRRIVCLSAPPYVRTYLQAGCRKADITDRIPEGKADLCWLDGPDEQIISHLGEHSVLVLDHLDRHREWFRSLPAVLTFDLYDTGIALFDTKYNKQHYTVNF